MRNSIKMLFVSALLATGGCVFDGGGSTTSESEETPPGVPPDPSSQESQVPQELIGQWYAGSGGTTAPYDPGTGSWGTPTGKGLLYVFSADGTFTKGFQSFVSSGGCTTGYTAASYGKLSFPAENRLTTRPDRGTFMYRDTCAPSLNSDEPLDDLSEETFDWAIGADEYDPSVPVLWLRRTDGAEAVFRRI